MIVRLATPLRSYTAARGVVDAEGATLAELLDDLDRRFPGLRFRIIDEQDRIRPHIKLFVNQDQVHTLAAPLAIGDQIHIVCALSGG
jgi:molybdopterin converting factor small subunit